jgi:hypothetical protein
MPCLRPVSSSDSLQDNRRPISTSGEERPEPYNPAINRIPRARPDELQALLADSSDNERAETFSLHSNPGRGRRGGKRKSKSGRNGKPRRITLFGFDLFGRPPIQLPDDDAEDDEVLLFRRHRSGSGSGSAPTPTTTLTTQTFDSDAAPLDVSTIQEITVSRATEAAEVEAKRLKEKEERRQRRKARKEMKRLVEAGVVGDGEDFEGFQGSGGLALLKRPTGAGGGITTTSSSGSHSREGFGRFVSAPPQAEEEDEEADLDGGLYTRKKSKGGSHSNGSSDSRNRTSLSRTSASASDRAPKPISQSTFPHQPLPAPKSKHSSQSRSRSNTSSQSPSLPSSPSSAAAFSEAQIVSPSTVEQGQGFFDLGDDDYHQSNATAGFPVGRIGGGGGGGFPMTGFAGVGNAGGGKRSRDFGAFLARRGEEEEGLVGDGV